MRFLFRLDLSLHANAGKKIVIMIFGTKHGARTKLVHDRMFPRYELIYYFFHKKRKMWEGTISWWQNIISSYVDASNAARNESIFCTRACIQKLYIPIDMSMKWLELGVREA